MQEEVENKTVNLAVQSVKLTFRLLYSAWRRYKDKLDRNHGADAPVEDETVKGKQTVKELIGQGEGVAKIEIEKTELKDFQKMAKKYGVDFAVVKDKKQDPPMYTVFFKAKDGAAIDKAMEAYAAKTLKVDKKKESVKERPSVLKKLEKLKSIVARTPRKAKEKKKELDR